jgi:molecular chaperone GrpE
MNKKEQQTLRQNSEDANEVRVTDRRRVYLDSDDVEQGREETQPNLKPTFVEELELRTQAAERQVQEVQQRFEQLRQQMQRETDETRQRLNKAADERAAGEKAKFIAALLPVMDDLTRAIGAAGEGASRESILEGVKRIAVSFQNALANAGVEPMSSIGEEFNPELHEAVETGDAPPELDNKVIDEYSRGFKLGDRLLRPARVKVGRSSSQAKIASEQ